MNDTTPKLLYTVARNGKTTEKNLFDVIDQTDLWQSGRTQVIGLAGIQKICNAEEIVEKKFQTEITPTADNKQQHAVNVWVGYKGDNDPDNWCRASGEASILNTGKVVTKNNKKQYQDFGEVDAQYRYAMADKRAFCRAVIKLIQLTGVYSEVEAKAFSKQASDIEGNDF